MNSTNGNYSLQTALHLGSNDVSKSKNEVSIKLEIRPSQNDETAAKGLPKDQVSISAEAAEKQLQEKRTENVDGSDSTKKTSIMELAEEIKQKMIDDIKERIKEVSEALQKLKAQDDESSKEQVKLLQGQLNDLNAQLLTIMSVSAKPTGS